MMKESKEIIETFWSIQDWCHERRSIYWWMGPRRS